MYSIAAIDTFHIDNLMRFLMNEFHVQFLPKEKFMEADFLLCDTFGFNHEKFGGIKIMMTGENHPADLNSFDYCISHALQEDDRRLYFPYWLYVTTMCGIDIDTKLLNRPALTRDDLVSQKRKFCAFVCRNGACRRRNNFVRKLSRQKQVDCGGSFMNNIGYCVPDKEAFQKDYLFSIAYENEAYPGYQTEKIIDSFVSRNIPIYWGNPLVEDIFNPEAFVHARRFRSDADLIRYLLELANDPDRQLQMLNAPIFRDEQIIQKSRQKLVDFFAAIFERGPHDIRRTRTQRIKAELAKYYGHGLFRTLRRLSRYLRGK